MKTLQALFTVFVLMLVSGMANAIIIDFEEYAHTPGATPTTQGDITSGGFLFDSATNHTHFVNNYSGGDSGSTFFGSDDFAGTTLLTMSVVGGDVFSLNSMDLGNWFEVSTSLQVTGNLSGGGTVSTIIALGAFNTYNFGWNNLDSITFDSLAGSGDQYYGMDNINVTVPEASTVILFGLGVLGLGIARRRKQVF